MGDLVVVQYGDLVELQNVEALFDFPTHRTHSAEYIIPWLINGGILFLFFLKKKVL